MPYRSEDGELLSLARSIGSLFDTAAYPGRVRVGVMVSLDKPAGSAASTEFSSLYRSTRQGKDDAHNGSVRIMEESHADARGFSSAMNMIHEHLYRGEMYAMTLRCGCTMQPRWDVALISQLHRCEMMSAHPVLTQRATEKMVPSYLRFEGWSEFGTPILVPKECRGNATRPLVSLFWTWELSFARASTTMAVRWDPWYEYVPARVVEWVHAIRLWTHGCDFYSPTLAICSAPSFREGGPVPPEADPGLNRVWCFLGMGQEGDCDLSAYECGDKRKMSAYATLTGVDQIRREVHPRARVGMRETRDRSRPFEDEEVVARYGSWREFYETTAYRPDDVWRLS